MVVNIVCVGLFGSGQSGNELAFSDYGGEAFLFCQTAERQVGMVLGSICMQILVCFPYNRLSKFVIPYGPD